MISFAAARSLGLMSTFLLPFRSITSSDSWTLAIGAFSDSHSYTSCSCFLSVLVILDQAFMAVK
jgi:hypothetical protein